MFCKCGESIDPARYKLGYKTCLICGEKAARQKKHTIAPLHKSNYILITDPELLRGINSKTHRG